MAESLSPYRAITAPCTLAEADEDDSDRYPFETSPYGKRDREHESDYARGYRDALEWVLALLAEAGKS